MVRAKGMGYRVAEVPISFVDRGENIKEFDINVSVANNIKFMGSLN